MSSIKIHPPKTEMLRVAQRGFTNEQLETLKFEARKRYPDNSLSLAVNKYIRFGNMSNAFFLMDGVRFMRLNEIDKNNRYHLYEDVYARVENRSKEINNKLGASFMHRSEKGWNKPQKKGERHILNLPLEIIENILSYVVCLPKDGVDHERMICPAVITSNHSSSTRHFATYSMIVDGHYANLKLDNEFLPPVKFSAVQKDWNGAYYYLQHVKFAPLTPGVLSCNLLLEKVASRILYGKNTFYFHMANRGFRGSPPTMMRNLKEHRPKPYKPFPALRPVTTRQEQRWEDEKPRMIRKGIRQILDRVDKFTLFGWSYYDPFLRFLHLIGPINASSIKKLAFNGIVMIHDCSRCGSKPPCSDDLVASLRIYAKFIVTLCPKLEKLTLSIDHDGRQTNFPPAAGRPQSFREALLPFLENELRAITSLRELIIVAPDGVDISFADETMAWVKESAQQRKRLTRETARDRDLPW